MIKEPQRLGKSRVPNSHPRYERSVPWDRPSHEPVPYQDILLPGQESRVLHLLPHPAHLSHHHHLSRCPALPFENGDRGEGEAGLLSNRTSSLLQMNLCLAGLLGLTFMLSVIVQELPRTAKIPLMGKWLLIQMCFCILGLAADFPLAVLKSRWGI